MSFGTTGRARLINALPLRQRFATAINYAGNSDEEIELLLHHPECRNAVLDYNRNLLAKDLANCPGWDADGRPVEP